MKPVKLILLASFVLLLTGNVAAQTTRSRPGKRPVTPRPAVSQPTTIVPSPTPSAARVSLPPVPLATVNGQTLTTADIDPRAREVADNLTRSIAEARRQMLELLVNTTLLELEAKRRKITIQQLYNLEVSKRVIGATAAEITEFIQKNRERIGDGDETAVRQQVAGLLRTNREAKIQEELVQRLRNTNPVVMGVDVNSPNLGASAVLATVAGQRITAAALLERLKPTIYKLQLNAYEKQKEALERTINDLLLIAEANRRNIPPEEIVRAEVSEKAQPPSEEEIAKFYSENKSRINGDLNSVRNQLAELLQEQARLRLEQAMNDRLRKGADVRVLLVEPQAPVVSISADDDPSLGDPRAPVTIVEFTDFQCPSCAAMHPILEEVLKTYGNKVRFVVRDFPLGIHANARKAAEAANAAHAQGKFFEYAALLFKRQSALDIPSLKKYATELGLDRARFDDALDKGTYAAEVRHDIDDGDLYGVDRTPTLFVNGVMLGTLSEEGLRAAIERALATPRPAPK